MSGSTTERWRVLLPPGWVSVPTEPTAARAAVRAATDRAVNGRHRDELVRARIEAEHLLLRQTEIARTQGAASVHLLVEPVAGIPISASLVVAEMSLGPAADVLAAASAFFGGAAGVVESDRVNVAGHEALRRRRRVHQELDRQTAPTLSAAERTLTMTYLEYLVVTGPEEYLLLQFTTSSAPVADEMVAIFEVIAATLTR